MNGRTVPILILLSFLLIAQPFMNAPNAAQKPTPGISIDVFYPSFVEVQTPLNKSIDLKFYTNITVFDPDNKTIDVKLNAFLYVDWAIDFSPKTMQFNSSGVRPAIITVTVPKNVSEPTEVQVHMKAFASYPNDTMETIAMGWISVKGFYNLGVNFQYVKKDQNMNIIEFNITNNGNDNDNIAIDLDNDPEVDREQIMLSLSNHNLQLEPGSNAKVRLNAEYYGSEFPKKAEIKITFRSITAEMRDYSPSQWTITVTVSYVRPDTTMQNYFFAAGITAFIVVMIIVIVLVVRNPSKK